LPSLERLKNIIGTRHLEILAIDVAEPKSVVEKFVKSGGYTFRVLLDTEAKVSQLYQVNSHPLTFIISPTGEMVGIAMGYRKWDSNAMLIFFHKLLANS